MGLNSNQHHWSFATVNTLNKRNQTKI